MNSWQDELMADGNRSTTPVEFMGGIAKAARRLGFEHCAYGARIPFQLSSPGFIRLSTYPVAWQDRYLGQNYIQSDPSVRHGKQSQQLIVWSDDLFSTTPQLWHEAQDHGLRFGLAQSILDRWGFGGMLTLSRGHGSISAREVDAVRASVSWLASLAHSNIPRLADQDPAAVPTRRLTGREMEVLKWTADGHTAPGISENLGISVDTVNFHIKNAVAKLGALNKTSAVVRAIFLGWLS